ERIPAREEGALVRQNHRPAKWRRSSGRKSRWGSSESGGWRGTGRKPGANTWRSGHSSTHGALGISCQRQQSSSQEYRGEKQPFHGYSLHLFRGGQRFISNVVTRWQRSSQRSAFSIQP